MAAAVAEAEAAAAAASPRYTRATPAPSQAPARCPRGRTTSTASGPPTVEPRPMARSDVSIKTYPSQIL